VPQARRRLRVSPLSRDDDVNGASRGALISPATLKIRAAVRPGSSSGPCDDFPLKRGLERQDEVLEREREREREGERASSHYPGTHLFQMPHPRILLIFTYNKLGHCRFPSSSHTRSLLSEPFSHNSLTDCFFLLQRLRPLELFPINDAIHLATYPIRHFYTFFLFL
jgi:hypothetical protein